LWFFVAVGGAPTDVGWAGWPNATSGIAVGVYGSSASKGGVGGFGSDSATSGGEFRQSEYQRQQQGRGGARLIAQCSLLPDTLY
jgi:hypothetical protein